MAYNKTTWANGDVITAQKLNNAEKGIAANDEEITGLNGDLGDLSDLNTTVKTDLVSAINEVASGGGGALTQDTKQALLQCFAHTAWTDDQGQDYYDDLEDALYPFDLLSSITAVYTQSGTVYDTDSLDSLKADLVVTGYYSDSTYNQTTKYTLSGTLTVGTSTITVTYGGKTTTFTVTVTQSAAVLTSISAVYTQSGTVYDTDSLDSLKSDLVVTAHYSDSSSETLSSSDYTLSGALTTGTSTVTVSYGGFTTTFTVTVTHATPTYVTDGLISRWDGIENTRNGHNASVTTWEDLVGSHDLVMNASTKVSWDTDGLIFSGQSNQHLADTTSGFGSDAVTVEIVLIPSEAVSAFVGWFGQSGLQRSACVYSDNTFSGTGASGKTYNTGTVALTGVHSVSFVYNANAATGVYRCNNVIASQGSPSHSFSVSENYNTVRIGNQMGSSGNYGFKGKICAIRVYNRQLTADELTQNYNLDLSRFGLGG